MFGDGEQQRDCLYVDDVVECLLLAARGARRAGSDLQRRQRRAALAAARSPTAIVAAAGSGRVEHVAWPPDRDAIDIGSYFGDSSKAKRMLGWEPRTSFADGIARTRRVLPGTCAPGTCDARRHRRRRASRSSTSPAGRRRSSPSSPRRSTRVVRSGALPPRPRARRVRARVRRRRPAAVTRSAWRRVPTRSASRSSRSASVRATRSSCPRSPRCRPRRRCARPARVPVFVDVEPDTATLDATSARAAVTDRTRAVIPVHLYGRPRRAPGPRRARASRTPPRPTARSIPRAGSAAAAYSFYPTKNLGGIGDGGAVVTDDDERRGDPPAAAGARPHRRLRAHARSPRTRACRSVEAAALRVGLAAARGARTPAGGRSRRATAPRRPTCGWQADARRATCTTCASPGSLTVTGSGSRLPFDTGVHYPRALTQQPAYEQFVALAVPGSRALGGRVRIVPVLPRDDRRRDRGGVSSAPVNPAVEAVSAFFPCYNDEATIARWSRSRSRRSTGRRRRRARSSSSTTGRPTARPRCSTSSRRAEPLLRVVTHERNRGYGGALLSGFAAAKKQWVFYTDGDGQFDPAELELLVRHASDDVDVVQGYKLRRADGVAAHGHRAGVPPLRQAHVRAADPRHRLRLPAHPPELARPGSSSCTRPASSAWSSCASCRTRARASPRSACTTTGVCTARRSSSGSPRSPRTLWDLAGLWVQMVVLRRGPHGRSVSG